MIIDLYLTEDDENVINKNLTFVKQLDINVSNDFDLENPEIRLLESSDFNYMVIDFNGWHYILDRSVKVNSEVTRHSFNLDVLETFKDEILNSYARFNRDIKEGDLNVSGVVENSSQVVTKAFSNVEMVDEKTLIMTVLGV